jgi:glycosyltransferase involved in cell wall biosynthesis
MRILYVTHQYPPAIGGAEKYVADLSQELAGRGHAVDVFTSRSLDYRTWANELDAHERVNGVNIYRFRSMRRTLFTWRVLRWSVGRYRLTRSRLYEPFIFLGGGPLSPGLFAALLSRLPQYDLVHLNSLVYSHALYSYVAARWRKVPVVITPHVHIDQELTYGVGYQLRVLRGSDQVIADTDCERDFMLGLGLGPERVITAGIGLRPEEYSSRDAAVCRQRLGIPADAFVMLFLGRQVEYKGLGTALEAFKILQKRCPNLYFVVAGLETDYSRDLFSRHQGRPGLIQLGTVSDDRRLDALHACDCLVLPSAEEAFGIVFLEAWIAGKPVIGPRTAAISSVIQDGVDGWLVPHDDPLALAKILEKWIDSPRLARQMGSYGRRKVIQRHTWKAVADVVEEAYSRAVVRKVGR